MSPLRGHRAAIAFATLAAAVIAAAVWLHGRPVGAPPESASAAAVRLPAQTSTGASSVPAWAEACLPKQPSERMGTADDYVGLNLDAAVRLAQRRGQQLVYAGGGGRCSNFSDDVLRLRPVAVVYDVGPAGHSGLPSWARVVAAELVSGSWTPGT